MELSAIKGHDGFFSQKSIKASPLSFKGADKLASSISADIIQFSSKMPGKHKVPRFLYHFTSGANFEKIKADGFLRPVEQIDLSSISNPKGIHMVDMNNFLKYWKSDKSWNGVFSIASNKVKECSLTHALMLDSAKTGDSIVCLKIPSRNLNVNSLSIRSQNKMYSSNVNRSYFKYGDDLSKKGLYNQLKEAVEYVYDAKIPLEDMEVVGSIKVKPESRTTGFNKSYKKQHKSALKKLEKLFEGRPESIGIKEELFKISFAHKFLKAMMLDV